MNNLNWLWLTFHGGIGGAFVKSCPDISCRLTHSGIETVCSCCTRRWKVFLKIVEFSPCLITVEEGFRLPQDWRLRMWLIPKINLRLHT
jgi:hypothetical protein